MRYSSLHRRASIRVLLTIMILWITVPVTLAIGYAFFLAVTTSNVDVIGIMVVGTEIGLYSGWLPAILLTGYYELARRWFA